ncbi:hypothetical protein CU024_0715 [Enterococcus faecium]|nr:hypothetical protein [Enterococcus faecium]MBK4787600.1 hypothetical protein [Enterococcus faecium]MBK4874685.1 hypothetical protein [Enterococcus faecium]
MFYVISKGEKNGVGSMFCYFFPFFRLFIFWKKFGMTWYVILLFFLVIPLGLCSRLCSLPLCYFF